ARGQVAAALGAEGADIVFTSGATEAAALALAGRDLYGSGIEHDAVKAWARAALAVDAQGRVTVPEPRRATLQLANSETGVIQSLPEGLAVSDLTQGFGKIPFAFDGLGIEMGFVSAHKIGGPKGVGALVLRRGTELAAQIRGGGQEMGRRSGTENIVGIAGFGAAAEAAAQDLAGGVWERVAGLRSILEISLDPSENHIILIGQDADRLPNTTCAAVSGWKGETQVMQLDLAGFAISAGSACSSGKARPSGVLEAMGHGPEAAAGAVRISLGPTTTEDDVLRFAETWRARLAKYRARAA
ncbi:MAG: aminotransferase class V-fold PLP-dependent enzyme, partial [Pseudomonadota bacterium]